MPGKDHHRLHLRLTGHLGKKQPVARHEEEPIAGPLVLARISSFLDRLEAQANGRDPDEGAAASPEGKREAAPSRFSDKEEVNKESGE